MSNFTERKGGHLGIDIRVQHHVTFSEFVNYLAHTWEVHAKDSKDTFIKNIRYELEESGRGFFNDPMDYYNEDHTQKNLKKAIRRAAEWFPDIPYTNAKEG